mgnify:CR=1 FL=1
MYIIFPPPSIYFFKLSAFLSKKLSPGPSPLLDFFHSSAITDNRRHYYKFQNYFFMKTLLFLLLAGTGFSCSSYLGTTTVQTPVQSFNAAAYNLPDSCEGFTPQDWIRPRTDVPNGKNASLLPLETRQDRENLMLFADKNGLVAIFVFLLSCSKK